MTRSESVETVSPPGQSERVPAFLTWLDSRPEAAFHEFYQFARRHLHRVPPAPSRHMSSAEREDLVHEIVYHCVRDDFRVLRRYRDVGQSFAAWFHVVAHRQALLHVRKVRTSGSEADRDAVVSQDSPQTQLVLRKVWLALSAMDAYCRRLLLLAAEEYTPRDIVGVLGLDRSANKKVGDQVRECRRKLEASLAGAGVDWRAVLCE